MITGTIESKPGSLQGTIEFELIDPNGVDPTEIIDIVDGFHLKAHLVVTGSFVPMLVGDWHVTLFAESIGQAFEGNLLDDKKVDIASGATTDPHKLEYNWNWPITVQGKKDKSDENLEFVAGPYKLAAVITCTNKAGHPGPFAAFAEFPIVQFYNS